jgi:hypothetical protein
MTLFISCLLIYHLDLAPSWYGVAMMFYSVHLFRALL